MTGLKMAQIRRCVACEFRWNATNWDWPRCAGAGFEEDGRPKLELNNVFMEGPASNCPRGYWDGLEPVDLEGERQAKQDRGVERMLEHPLLKHLDNSALVEALEEMVATGRLPVEMAERVAERRGVNLDAGA